MPLQNRVDPFGDFHTISARGDLMGNRGILHDDKRNVLKTHAHQNWVACALSYKDRQRQIMAPGRYTELFFLDEATALSAGHRPCATCRRERYLAFTGAWKAAHGGPKDGRSLPHTIDRILHAARIARRGKKVTHEAERRTLPDGTFFVDRGNALLSWQGESFLWSFGGYTRIGALEGGMVEVLTPEPIVAVLRHGYCPELHHTFEAARRCTTL